MLDTKNLQEEVMQYWEDQGTRFTSPDSEILPKFQKILDDPLSCIDVLGFNSISSYIASRRAK